MEKNFLSRVVVIVVTVVVALLCLYWLPAVNVGTWSMRKVDLLADLRNGDRANAASADDEQGKEDNGNLHNDKTSAVIANLPPVLEGSRLTHDKDGNVITVEDSIIASVAQVTPQREGITSIIDMSGGAAGGMSSFYSALDIASARPVRIAVLGDSFIEGDIMTAMLRELLQQRFGGSGCGYLPMTSITAKNRVTVRQSFGGWTQHKAVDRNGYVDTYNNLTGNYFNASPGAWVNVVTSGMKYQHAASCTSSSFYYLGGGGTGLVTAFVNGVQFRQFTLTDTETVGCVTVNGDITSAKWVVDNPANIVFLGTSLDSDNGVIVDNLAMRSSRGTHLKDINDRLLTGFNQVRPYDLVIIMYGLNVAGKVNSEFTQYCSRITAAIENIKRAMPRTSIMLVSCSDREERNAGGFHTMRGVLGLIQAQKRVAINTRVAFWDLYEAMGGEGSIVNMVNRGEASSDYTHLTPKGGDRIARLLYDALMLGYEKR